MLALMGTPHIVYELYVDHLALPGREHAGDPPIILRTVEVQADGRRVSLGRTKHFRVDLPGPSALVSDLSGDAPHIWVETDVTPLPRE